MPTRSCHRLFLCNKISDERIRSVSASLITREHLTVRNLTAQPLTVKLIERFDGPVRRGSLGASVANITSNITNLLSSNDNNQTKARLSVDAQSFARQDVDIRVEPFTTARTDIKTTERGPNEIFRLTIEGEGGPRWTIDAPTPSIRSEPLSPQTDNPPHDYNATYIPESSLLAIQETIPLNNWLSHLSDSTPLPALSIPGTHNSPTCHKALPSVRCQAVSPLLQLQNGVRFFDIRVQPSSPDDPSSESLNLVHSAFPISLTGSKKFRDLTTEIETFLHDNPTETLIMSLKREGTGPATDQQLAAILRDHYAHDPTNWYTEPRMPTLGEVRGKIVLLRRFALDDRLKGEYGGKGWGLVAENWADNTPDNTCGDVRVQDFYEVLETENIDKKIGFCCDHFERAAGVRGEDGGVVGPLFLNFLSASNFWKAGCWPDRIAAKLNPAVTRFICEKHCIGDRGIQGPGEVYEGDGNVGVVICDWVGEKGDWDLVRNIVGLNGRLLLKQRGKGWK